MWISEYLFIYKRDPRVNGEVREFHGTITESVYFGRLKLRPLVIVAFEPKKPRVDGR